LLESFIDRQSTLYFDGMIKLFADDTKVFASVNNEGDKNSLQGDIDKLMNWSDTWLLKFNKSKCKHMHEQL
jgi:hypothetical protein